MYDYDKIESTDSFLIGTTNQIILNNNKLKHDCLINLDTVKIQFNINEKLIKWSKYEKKIYSNLVDAVKPFPDYEKESWMINMEIKETQSSRYEGSDDFIRNEFKQYFFNLAIIIDLSIKLAKEEIEYSQIDQGKIENDKDKREIKDLSNNRCLII